MNIHQIPEAKCETWIKIWVKLLGGCYNECKHHYKQRT